MAHSDPRRSNSIALALLILALVVFVIFHFLPWWEGQEIFRAGWMVWPAIITEISRMRMDEEIVAAGAFLTMAVLMVSGPFLLRALQQSRLVWWLALVLSLSASLSLAGIILVSLMWRSGDVRPGSGMFCLMVSQAIFVCGLCCIRRVPIALPGSEMSSSQE